MPTASLTKDEKKLESSEEKEKSTLQAREMELSAENKKLKDALKQLEENNTLVNAALKKIEETRTQKEEQEKSLKEENESLKKKILALEEKSRQKSPLPVQQIISLPISVASTSIPPVGPMMIPFLSSSQTSIYPSQILNNNGNRPNNLALNQPVQQQKSPSTLQSQQKPSFHLDPETKVITIDDSDEEEPPKKEPEIVKRDVTCQPPEVISITQPIVPIHTILITDSSDKKIVIFADNHVLCMSEKEPVQNEFSSSAERNSLYASLFHSVLQPMHYNYYFKLPRDTLEFLLGMKSVQQRNKMIEDKKDVMEVEEKKEETEKPVLIKKELDIMGVEEKKNDNSTAIMAENSTMSKIVSQEEVNRHRESILIFLLGDAKRESLIPFVIKLVSWDNQFAQLIEEKIGAFRYIHNILNSIIFLIP